MTEPTRKRKLIDDTEEVNNAPINNPIDPLTSTSSSSPITSIKPSGSLNEDLLNLYYERLFPYHWFLEWLSPNDIASLPRREFSFTLAGDIYIRYQSISSKEELKKALTSRNPHKIDIGAMFNVSPALHNTVNLFTPISKELVFDVDMTDYDNVRTCCQEGNICHKCWPFMTSAIKVIDASLRHDFGFKHLLWVYSGRRGVHCWVCDPRAKILSNEQRTAVVDYLSLQLGGEQSKSNDRRSNLTFPLHPMLSRALDQITPFFDAMIENQHWLEDVESRERFLSYIDENARDELKFSDVENGAKSWELFKSRINRTISHPPKGKLAPKAIFALKESLKTAEARIVLGHVYPRLDANVSKQLNHLLKAPFCVHPKTSRVCVPIDPERAEDFNYLDVPTLEQLEMELNQNTSSPKTKPYEQTSLKPYLEYFHKFVQGLQEQAKMDNKLKGPSQDW